MWSSITHPRYIYFHIITITLLWSQPFFFKVKGLKINLPTHSLCERELGIAWHYQKKERREDILTSKSCARIWQVGVPCGGMSGNAAKSVLGEWVTKSLVICAPRGTQFSKSTHSTTTTAATTPWVPSSNGRFIRQVWGMTRKWLQQ